MICDLYDTTELIRKDKTSDFKLINNTLETSVMYFVDFCNDLQEVIQTLNNMIIKLKQEREKYQRSDCNE